MDLKELAKQYQGRKFGELVLFQAKRQSMPKLIAAMIGTKKYLPIPFQAEIVNFISEFKDKTNEAKFWNTDLSDTLISITNKAKDIFLKNKINPSDDDLFNAFNVIVLNFSFESKQHIKLKTFIKRSMGIGIWRVFKKKDIPESYRWSIIFKKNGTPQYEMLGDNVLSMIGYYIVTLQEQGSAKIPWSLHLRFNKTNQEFELYKDYFKDQLCIELFKKIEEIDPQYQRFINSLKREIFIYAYNKKEIRIEKVNEIGKTKGDEISFLNIMENIFENYKY